MTLEAMDTTEDLLRGSTVGILANGLRDGGNAGHDDPVQLDYPLETPGVAVLLPSVTVRLQLAVKRAIDVIGACLGIVLFSPVWIVIAVAVGLTSPGPVLYRQRRLMRGGRVFTMYKFRTMVDGAESLLDDVFHLNQANGPLFKSKDDPRITPVGRFLRRHYLDELPQLINVLKGEMSLVGPRPCLAREADQSRALAYRFAVPQGLTGPWQTNGHHAITFEEQLRVERDYIDRWSIGSDIRILALTLVLVMQRTGL
jgi:lipopolysaccharide/colanic/teichoic acid biosynthesis glycosyltransferase